MLRHLRDQPKPNARDAERDADENQPVIYKDYLGLLYRVWSLELFTDFKQNAVWVFKLLLDSGWYKESIWFTVFCFIPWVF